MDAQQLKLFLSLYLCILLCACVPDSLPDHSQVSILVHQQSRTNIKFTAKNSSLPINNLRWDYGDGYSASGVQSSHTYLAPGNYTVTLTYEQNQEIKTQQTSVNIDGQKENVTVIPSHNVIIDSDHNDPNQPFQSNDVIPQPISSPAQVSGILMASNACQAGRLCDTGDTIDRFEISIHAGQQIVLTELNGKLSTILTDKNGIPIPPSQTVLGQHYWPAHDLSDGTYLLTALLAENSTKAQYFIDIKLAEPVLSSRYQPGKLIVKWRNKPSPEMIDLSDPRINQSKDIVSARSTLNRLPTVEWADFNYYRRASIYENEITQWPLIQSDVNSLWAPLALTGKQPGQDAVVAVLDTGVYLEHHNFQFTRFQDGYDFVSDAVNSGDGNGWDTDPTDPGDQQLSYHGSHVTGIIAATPKSQIPSAESGLWISGIAWGATIMPLRVLGLNGGTSYDLIQALRYAAGLPNDTGRIPSRAADIINLSLGGDEYSVIEHRTIQEVIETGAIIVAASGNQGSSKINYPAAYPNVISVAANDINGSIADYSNINEDISLIAPGGDCNTSLCLQGILSVSAYGSLSEFGYDNRQSSWKRLSGTSMATAHVSGVLAILKSHLPGMDSHHLQQWIQDWTLTDNVSAQSAADILSTGAFKALNSEKVMTLMNEHDGLSNNFWLNHKELFLEKGESKDISIITRGEYHDQSYSVEYDQTRFAISIQNHILTITAKTDIPQPEWISIQNSFGQARNLKVLGNASSLPSFSDHLYISISDSYGGFRTVRSESMWTAQIPVTPAETNIQASTDIDYDGVYCEPGEFCATSTLSNSEHHKVFGDILH